MKRQELARRLALLAVAALLASASPAWAGEAPAAAEADQCGRAGMTIGPQPGESLQEYRQRTKNPVSWFEWGFDLRLREIYAPNLIFNNKNLDDDPLNSKPQDGPNWHFQRYRSRLWAKIKPVEDIDLNVRLVYEPRTWCKPKSKKERTYDEAIFDHMNVVWRNPLGLPVTATVGRQDIILGNGWLVLDGTPLDGSRTIFFDAARLTWNFPDYKTKVETIWIDQHADSDRWLEPFCDADFHNIEQNEKGAIVYVTNTSLPQAQIDGYFIYKRDEAVLCNGNTADIYTFGARAAGDLDSNWKYRAEFAQQFGNKNGQTLCAWGFNSRLSYFLNDAWNNNFRVGYEYLSGDDPSTDRIEAFDPLWGRWPQWSELYIYNYAIETRIAETTNLHRLGLGWGFNPCKKTEVCLDYHLLWRDENTVAGRSGFSNEGPFRGQLLTGLLRYKFNENITGHLLAELFFPGNYYTDLRNDVSGFFRYEIVFAW